MKYEYTNAPGENLTNAVIKRGNLLTDTIKAALRQAKKEVGLNGVSGRITNVYPEGVVWRPYNSSAVLLITWGEW